MRKKLITLMMIFTSLGMMYVSAEAKTSDTRNAPNTGIDVNSPLRQTRYIRYRGRLYRVNVQRVSRSRRYRNYRPRRNYYRTYYRPRVRYIRIPRIRYYRSYNRRYNRPRVRYSRYYNYYRY